MLTFQTSSALVCSVQPWLWYTPQGWLGMSPFSWQPPLGQPLKTSGKHVEGISHCAAVHLQLPAKVTRGNNKTLQESPFLCHLNTGRKHWKCLKNVFLMSSQPSLAEAKDRGSLQVPSSWNSLFYPTLLWGKRAPGPGYFRIKSTFSCSLGFLSFRAQEQPQNLGLREGQGQGLAQSCSGWAAPSSWIHVPSLWFNHRSPSEKALSYSAV